MSQESSKSSTGNITSGRPACQQQVPVEYVELLSELIDKTTQRAIEDVPKLYYMLRNSNFSRQEARARVERDLAPVWSMRTIRLHMPDEAKQVSMRRMCKPKKIAASTAAIEFVVTLDLQKFGSIMLRACKDCKRMAYLRIKDTEVFEVTLESKAGGIS
jgi:hypothetical protein